MTTPVYAAAIAAVFVVLSFRTLLLRRKAGVGIGSGDDPKLARAMRVHANFAEYVPLALILLYFLEIRAGDSWWLHALGASLIAGRIAHAYGVSQVREDYRFRVVGMVLTLGVLISASLRILLSYVA